MTSLTRYGPGLATLGLILLAGASPGQRPPAFANSVDTPPTGWTGPVFELSTGYPTALPVEAKPWKAFDFKTQPAQYMQAVLAYCLEGNEAVNWKVQDNAIRKWYHAPGLLGKSRVTPSGGIPASGREFIHGLTRERVSKKAELDPLQTTRLTNWAVGFYNPTAAFTIGKVWANPLAPNTTGVQFDDGSVAFKLLFTTATATQVPNLLNSLKWQANADQVDQTPASIDRSVRDVLLLQIDVAVRDDRADTTTGWLFGTFMYQADATGATPFERMVPVGLMWGNDPGLTQSKYATGDRPTESWLNKTGMPATKRSVFGWLDRLNGPVDNPLSSCLSCHARAVARYDSSKIAPGSASAADDPMNKFFTNTNAGAVYDGAPAGVKSLDYSLQLAVGTLQFPGTPPPPSPSPTAVTAGARPTAEVHFNDRGGEPEDPVIIMPRGGTSGDPAVPKDVTPAKGDGAETNWWLWAGGGVAFLVIVGLIVWSRSGKPAGA